MRRFEPSELRQEWLMPSAPRPIVIIGAGDIVRDAHLPAYRKAGLPVAGLFDIDPNKARLRAEECGGLRVFASVVEAVATPGAVFDLAVPPAVHDRVLRQLPDGAVVLLQKPMGQTLAGAAEILESCRRKRLVAAVNFQLRFAPHMLAIRDLIARGEIGDLVELEVRLNLQTPWELFPFLLQEPRVEIQIHTVHYLDLARSILGEPGRVYARTVRHPKFPALASTRSSIILDYGDMIRCCFSINHCHPFGPRHSDASVRVEGTDGCAVATFGALMDYPVGRADTLEVITHSTGDWVEVPLRGGWFPDAFIGTMSNLQRFAAGEDPVLVSSAEDAFQTMRLVEACYRSDAAGGSKLEDL